MLLYVAGPYSGILQDENIENARALALELFRLGHTPICPHLNFNHFERDLPAVTHDEWLRRDFGILDRCDGMVVVEGWENSVGTESEIEYCRANGIPIWFAPNLPELHLTEQRCPVQTKEFAKLLGSIYRLHLSKNASYSPANILGLGEVGMAARLWDKTARLLNLIGYRMDVRKGSYERPLDPNHEAIEDTYQDLACYALIGILLRAGNWGR